MADFTPPGCDDITKCSDLENCSLDNLGDVNTGPLQPGEVLTVGTNGEWTNETPATVAAQEVADAICSDQTVIDTLAAKINTDDQTASEVNMDSGETVEDCVTDLKSRMEAVEGNAISTFTNLNDVVTITEADGDTYAVTISHPVVSLNDNGGSFDLVIDGSIVQTIDFPVVTTSENADGSVEDILVDGVIVGTFIDEDTVSTAHPVYTIGEDANGDTILLEDGVQVGAPVPDSDTVSPALTFAANPTNGTDVSIGGVVVYTIPDNDTVSSPHPVYTFTENADGDLEVTQDGTVIATIDDADTVSSPHPVITFAPNATNGTDVLIDGAVVYTIPDTDVVITPTVNADGSTTYTFVEGGNTVGTIDTMPDTNQGYVTGPVTTNADGSIEVCLSPVWVTHPTIAAGTSTGEPDTCFTIPASTPSSLTVDAAARSYVHDDGDGTTTTLPVATALPCNVAAPTGLADDKWVSDWVDRAIQWDTAAFTGYTTICNRVAINTRLADVSAPFGTAISVNTGSVDALYSLNAATLISSTGTNPYNAVIAGIGLVNNGQASLLTGRDNTNEGPFNLVSGRGHSIPDNFVERSFFSGAFHTAPGAGAISQSHGFLGGTSNSIAAAQNTAALGGRRYTLLHSDGFGTGYNAGGATLSSNRTIVGYGNGGNIDIAGVYSSGVVFPDVAEMLDNDKNGIIPCGTPVTIKGKGIAPASDGDHVIGVVSGAYAVLLGDSDASEQSKYLLDDFGCRVKGDYEETYTEDIYKDIFVQGTDSDGKPVKVKQSQYVRSEEKTRTVNGYLMNPDFDPSVSGKKKSDTPEKFSAVALVGQPPAMVGKSVKVGDFLKASGGILVKSKEPTNIVAYKKLKAFDAKAKYAIFQIVK